jgi:hypothetical protein
MNTVTVLQIVGLVTLGSVIHRWISTSADVIDRAVLVLLAVCLLTMCGIANAHAATAESSDATRLLVTLGTIVLFVILVRWEHNRRRRYLGEERRRHREMFGGPLPKRSVRPALWDQQVQGSWDPASEAGRKPDDVQ